MSNWFWSSILAVGQVPQTGLPIDVGLLFLLIAGIVYGVKTLKN
jgi:hypothetical protein